MKRIHCKKTMELKSVGTRVSYWDLFFQCSKCGEVLLERIDERDNHHQVNFKLDASGRHGE